MQRKVLGKGLQALIPQERINAIENRYAVHDISLKDITPNRYQPREKFDEERLKELTASIKEKGIVQPIIIRKGDNGYELIAGERRFRAAKRLSMETIPAIIRESSDIDSLETAIIENVQREDLNPLEEAKGYKQLIDRYNYTQEHVATVVGKERSSVTNLLRLLKLPDSIKLLMSSDMISMGHARALLSLDSKEMQETIGAVILKKGLSVRQTEAMISEIKEKKEKSVKKNSHPDKYKLSLEEHLQRTLGTKVRIIQSGKKGGGRIEIYYYTDDEFERIYDIIR